MRILMLGWEFPPFISGGLGTACYGLTRALDAAGHEVIFVLPRPVDRSYASHVRLLSPDSPLPEGEEGAAAAQRYQRTDFKHTTFIAAPSVMSSTYTQDSPVGEAGSLTEEEITTLTALGAAQAAPTDPVEAPPGGSSSPDYGGDVINDAQRYAALVLALCRHERFDVIHAHDWMTYPAGLAMARATNHPLVVHIHSTEFDRSGENVNQRVYDIERRGMHGAIGVIAVSELTKKIVVHRYGLSREKVHVCYNGIDPGSMPDVATEGVREGDKIVLFLGRITMQKGPEYFIAAAKRVLEKVDNVKFVIAGSGDMARRMIELAAGMGIGHKVLFTGFLRGPHVSRIFRMADLYVMPSVSEPFGIAPLEAISQDTPVLISKQSGVSEVLTHALKVDFWDIDQMADKIIAVLTRPPLSKTLRRQGAFEIRSLTWEGAATRCEQVYTWSQQQLGAPTA